jgi:hypothetical protein
MKYLTNSMINKILTKPTKIFLIDSIGAFLTAILIGLVLTHFQEYIGMPFEILFAMAGIALVFCIYSLSCYLFLNKNWKAFLGAIAIANSLYCVLTTILIIKYFDQLTAFGILYFIGEIVLVLVLVYFEFLIIKK